MDRETQSDLRYQKFDKTIARLVESRVQLFLLARAAAERYERIMASPRSYFREQLLRTMAHTLMKIPILPQRIAWRSKTVAEKRAPNRFRVALDDMAANEEKKEYTGLESVINFDSAAAFIANLSHAANRDPEHYRDHSEVDLPSPMPVRTVAFYLPQFHAIPENDQWWGKGFTEWTNVTKALPRFPGHYQPRFPGELGYYDLRVPSIIAQQIRLARLYGLYGFCFHYYWFAGRRVLEKPLDVFKEEEENIDFDFPFCINWANENWTRRWDGLERDVLLAQKHSLEDHRAVFRDIARYISDRRYIRINGRPLIVVYRPAIINDVSAMCEIWREEAAKYEVPGLELFATNAFGYTDYKRDGFDGLVQFPPHVSLSTPTSKALSPFEGTIFDYKSEAELQIEQFDKLRLNPRDRIFPCVFPGWDNEPRRPGRGCTYHGSTPKIFSRWFSAACNYTSEKFVGDERLVFVNAWNEWAEGAYLEPDRRFGYAYLQAIRDTIRLHNDSSQDSGRLATDALQVPDAMEK